MRQSTREKTDSRTAFLASELRMVIGKLKRRMREQGTAGDLTLSQAAVLSRLDREGPSTVTALARGEGMRSQSMGAIVSALENDGLVVGAQDPNDGRQTIYSLTARCRKFIQTERAAREDWLSQAIQNKFKSEEMGNLEKAVELLKRLAEV